jgi:hypothetical protein
MTRTEMKLALKQLEDRGAYSLRLFLDNHTTVLAHRWFLDEGNDWKGKGKEAILLDDREGLLHVAVRGRQALIAISHIVGIEMVPFGW